MRFGREVFDFEGDGGEDLVSGGRMHVLCCFLITFLFPPIYAHLTNNLRVDVSNSSYLKKHLIILSGI